MSGKSNYSFNLQFILPFIPPFFLQEKLPDVSPLPLSVLCFCPCGISSPSHAPRPPKRTYRSWCSIMQRRAPASSWEIACRTKARRALGVGSTYPLLTLRAYENHWFPFLNPCFCGGYVGVGWLAMMGWVGGWDGIEFLKVRWGEFSIYFFQKLLKNTLLKING